MPAILPDILPDTGRQAFRAMRTQFRIGLRNVLRQPRRTASGVAAIVFGVVAMMLAAGFVEWSNWSLRETTIHSRLGHIQILRKGYMDSGLADPFAFLLEASAAEQRAVEAIPGVVTVAPRLSFSGLISVGDTTLSFAGEGMDPAKELDLASSVLMATGTRLAADDETGVILGEGLAANLGASVGDKVVLLVNTKTGSINAVEARVRGLFSTVSKAYDDSALRVPLRLGQRLLRTNDAHAWVVLLDDTDRTAQVMMELRTQLSGKLLEPVAWFELADFYKKAVVLFSKQVAVINLIIAIIIVLSISNTLTMSVMERTGEIGTAMALGMRRRRLLGQFLSEGIWLGVLGGLLGLALGLIAARLISHVGIPLPPPPGQSRAYVGQIFVTCSVAAQAAALALTTTLVASIFPAWKASRLVIVDALRHNR
jgi:putative ABC transport system permease protein